jgi:hypothetical protein
LLSLPDAESVRLPTNAVVLPGAVIRHKFTHFELRADISCYQVRGTPMALNRHRELEAYPLSEAEELALPTPWRTTANKPGCARGARAHVSFAISACVAGVAALPYAEQQKLLLAGARSILERDAKSPAREQIRLYRSATIRPAGAARAI